MEKITKYELVHRFLNLRDMLLVRVNDSNKPSNIVFRAPIFRGVGMNEAKLKNGHYAWTNQLNRAIDYAKMNKNPCLLVKFIEIPKNRFSVKYLNQMLGISDDFTDYDFKQINEYLKPDFVFKLE